MKKIIAPLLLSLAAGCADMIPLASGELEGVLRKAPADWTQVSVQHVIELETNPVEPYSVKLWIVGFGEKLYVHAGTNRARWVENMEADPSVRLLIGPSLYELEGSRVNSQDEFEAFADAYEQKYGSRPGNESVTEAYLYRLAPRN